jgi:hypothetical protein
MATLPKGSTGSRNRVIYDGDRLHIEKRGRKFAYATYSDGRWYGPAAGGGQWCGSLGYVFGSVWYDAEGIAARVSHDEGALRAIIENVGPQTATILRSEYGAFLARCAEDEATSKMPKRKERGRWRS